MKDQIKRTAKTIGFKLSDEQIDEIVVDFKTLSKFDFIKKWVHTAGLSQIKKFYEELYFDVNRFVEKEKKKAPKKFNKASIKLSSTQKRKVKSSEMLLKFFNAQYVENKYAWMDKDDYRKCFTKNMFQFCGQELEFELIDNKFIYETWTFIEDWLEPISKPISKEVERINAIENIDNLMTKIKFYSEKIKEQSTSKDIIEYANQMNENIQKTLDELKQLRRLS